MNDLQRTISQDQVFSNIAEDVAHLRKVQAMKHFYAYTASGSIAANATTPVIISIEQGTDFLCERLTVSADSYNAAAGSESIFPMPNGAGNVAWAGRGLSVRITDTRAGRELTSGFIPIELLGTPGYGMNFQQPYPFKYMFLRNSKIRFEFTNRDYVAGTARVHNVNIALVGFKIMTPDSGN